MHVLMVRRDTKRGRNAKCAANEDETLLHVFDYDNITYQAVGVVKAARFGFFLVRVRTNMDPNKWVIFAYDRAPAHRDSAIPPALYVQSLCFPHPPTPYVQSLCFTPPPNTSTSWNRYKSRLKATIKADISYPEIYRRKCNEAKAPGIPLGELEFNNCSP